MNYKLLNMGTYIGPIKRENQYYINHFKKRNKDIGHLFKDVLGRNTIRLTDNKNSLTMAIEAVDRALKKNHLLGKDLDIILFGTSLPEYLCPTCSLLLHYYIRGKEECICLDVNMNCAGMVATMEIAKNMLDSNSGYKRALIIGSDNMNAMSSSESEYCYGVFGDAACALIIEKTEENSNIIDFNCKTDSRNWKNMTFPSNGISGILRKDIVSKKEMLLRYVPPRENIFVGMAVEQINSILEKNDLLINDISLLCLSQYTLKLNEDIERLVGLDPAKSIFVGDKYGYTATTSPFLVLREALREHKIKRGDYVVFWTIGTGAQGVCSLIRY